MEAIIKAFIGISLRKPHTEFVTPWDYHCPLIPRPLIELGPKESTNLGENGVVNSRNELAQTWPKRIMFLHNLLVIGSTSS